MNKRNLEDFYSNGYKVWVIQDKPSIGIFVKGERIKAVSGKKTWASVADAKLAFLRFFQYYYDGFSKEEYNQYLNNYVEFRNV